ncbi:MAG: hypothetical protein ACKPKO_20235, partial [Candidatus Fonsibacter sp.]
DEEDDEEEEQRPTTDSWGLDHTPPPPVDENGNIVPHIYQGRNWQVRNLDTENVSITESRCISTICPYCQTEFVSGQMIAKFRCGHGAYTDCYEEAVKNKWHRCTLCRRSARARAVHVVDEPDVDLSVFVRQRTQQPLPRTPPQRPSAVLVISFHGTS